MSVCRLPRHREYWRPVCPLAPPDILSPLVDQPRRRCSGFQILWSGGEESSCLLEARVLREKFLRHGQDLARSERRKVSGLVCPSVVRSIGESFRSNPWLVLAVRVWLTFWWLRRVSSEVGAFLLLASPFSGCGGGVVWLAFSIFVQVQYCGGLASSSNPNKSIPGVLALVVPQGKATLLFSVDAHCAQPLLEVCGSWILSSVVVAFSIFVQVQYCGGLASSSNPNKSIPGVLALVVPQGKATLLFSVDAHCIRSV
ncbi:hypothetical protein DY000_02029516 [Brassica cretica]|uniref:Uncharacterized protein n=1 Tax=Brassica cretica TaxID=69181 RepID=A0ABQ7DF96_BRACR|nr:hypothetical protein DY000_02029516 [Brassica cretica]